MLLKTPKHIISQHCLAYIKFLFCTYMGVSMKDNSWEYNLPHYFCFKGVAIFRTNNFAFLLRRSKFTRVPISKLCSLKYQHKSMSIL